MYRILIVVLGVLILCGGVLACTSQAKTSQDVSAIVTSRTQAETGIESLLAKTPYSILERSDIWYSNPGALKTNYKLNNLTSREAYDNLNPEEQTRVLHILAGIYLPQVSAASLIFPLDSMMLNQAINSSPVTDDTFYVLEGNYDSAAIIEKMIAAGYQKRDYQGSTYYRNDVPIGFSPTPTIRYFIAKIFSRVAIQGSLLVITSDDQTIESILATINSGQRSLKQNTACAALAKNLGDSQFAVLIPVERILDINSRSKENPLSMEAAKKWQNLHDYQMAALAFSDTGNRQEWRVSLFYTNRSDAEADAANLKSRMESYYFSEDKEPLKESFDIGNPQVTAYGDGATLTIKCGIKGDISTIYFRLVIPLTNHDLYFLAVDPAAYANP